MKPILMLSLLTLLALGLRAEDVDPGALYDEANAIMGAYRDNKASTEEYAAAIIKLEHALNYLEKSGKGSTDLATEIASSLFWAGKMSNINVTRAVEKLRAQGGLVPPSRFAKPGTKKGETGEAVMTAEDKQAKAIKEYQAAKEYAAKKKGEDLAIAQRWFLVPGGW